MPHTSPLALLALALSGALASATPAEARQSPETPVEAPAEAAAPTDPALADAERMPRAAESILLDIAATPQGPVIVGERGHVLRSTDGEAWEQVVVPTRAMLTTVFAVGDALWAAGHDGVILHTPGGDAGWTRQRVAPWTPDDFDPAVGVPVLDLLFLDAQRGFAIGAYALMLTTTDGGATWTSSPVAFAGEPEAEAAPAEPEAEAAPAEPEASTDAEAVDDWSFSADELMLEDEVDPHYNAITRTGSGALLIAGERGTILRSRDEGATWERVALPYEGSMFGALGGEGDHVVVYGLRGNAFETRDLGDTWTRLETGVTASLMGGALEADGGLVLVGANGAVLVREAPTGPLVAHTYRTPSGETPNLAGAWPREDGSIVVLGDRGVGVFRMTDARETP